MVVLENKYSLIANTQVSFFNEPFKDVYSWLNAKSRDDNTEGLWRIHDDLYDLTNFIDHHPGGRDWLIYTKGTDITEAFEVHHLNEEKVRQLLKKFHVREASGPRNIKLTFSENGFYKTLKRRVAEKLPTINRKPEILTKLYSDLLLFSTFLVAILSVKFQNSYLIALAGLLLTLTIVTAHNFFHRRDNFRMKYFNLCLFSYREWRISHALSHHLFPNSLQDLEVIIFEPMLSWLPDPKLKGTFKRYASWIYGPILWTLLYTMEFIKRIQGIVFHGKPLHLDDLLPFSVPLAMYIFGGGPFTSILYQWFGIVLWASFYFGLVGFNAGHHHPEVIHDGDAIREDLDWGLYSMDTIIDRHDLKGSSFLVLTHFGHHAMHHLFPTLDHGILDQLYPELFQTMEEFEGELRSFYWYSLIAGQFKQLARTEPMVDCPLTRSRLEKSKKMD